MYFAKLFLLSLAVIAVNQPSKAIASDAKPSIFSKLYMGLPVAVLNKGEDINAIDESTGHCLLAYAVKTGSKGLVEHLANKKEVIFTHANRKGETVFHELMKKKGDSWIELTGLIIERNSKSLKSVMSKPNISGWTPLDLLYYGGNKKLQKIVGNAIDLTPYQERAVKIKRYKNFLQAIVKNDIQSMNKLIHQDKSLVNFADINGYAPLSFAGASKKNKRGIQVLLDNGADPLGNKYTAFSPVEWAISNNNRNLLNAMKTAGVSLEDVVIPYALQAKQRKPKTIEQLIREYGKEELLPYFKGDE